MGIDCGSQIVLCDLPIRLDTYKGCSHACEYCFARRESQLNDIQVLKSSQQLLNFINGKRTERTKWCDWDIPIHWGGMSDPFQPVETKYRESYKCLQIFSETKYPFVVSTKGKIVAEPEYLDLINQCNCVVQISMICDKFDRLEKGAPTYKERLEMCHKISKKRQGLL